MKIILIYLLAFITLSKTISSQTGAALSFDGIDDYIQMNDPNFGTSDFTIEGWIKPNNMPAFLVMTRTSELTGAGNYCDLVLGNGSIYLELGAANSSYSVVQTPTTAITLGNWYHVAAVRSGMQLLVYVNGALLASATETVTRNLITGNNSLRLGGWPNTNNGWYNGLMDEVRIWNIARSQCQINSYMNCEIPSSTPGLLANYHFNNGVSSGNNPTVTVLPDFSGTLNNGALTNFALNGSNSNWVSPGGVVSGYTNVANSPSISSSSSSSLICIGQSATLTANGAATYTWNPGSLSGASISITPTITTNYTVSGTSAVTTCTNSSIFTQSVSTCSGIYNYTNPTESTIIYPNPSNGVFYFENLRNQSQIEIIDLTGRTIVRQEVNSSGLDLSNFDNGIYFYKITGEKSYTGKLVKQ